MTESDTEIGAAVLRERIRLGDFIRRRVRNPADADDILQDVLHEFVEACRLPAPIESAGAWLFRVARNRIIDLFRKKMRQSPAGMQEPEAAGDESRLDLLLPAPDGDPEAAYARSVLLTELQAALDELPPDQRAVFVAHELYGISGSEPIRRERRMKPLDPCTELPGAFMPVVSLKRCEGKGDCVKVCPEHVFRVQRINPNDYRDLGMFDRFKLRVHGMQVAYTPNADACLRCGLCVSACPERAITLQRRGTDP